ncbi:MAG: hypothetical protein WC697_03550 [Patescibacteria group bacterium]|jgi:hypothetical protein
MRNPEQYHPTIEQTTENKKLSMGSRAVVEEVEARKNKGVIIEEQETYGKFFGTEEDVFKNAVGRPYKIKNTQIVTELVKAIGHSPEKIIKAS